jgi:hypothetical protein
MPMFDVYAVEGTFADKHALARDLTAAGMRWEQVPDTGSDLAEAARAEIAQHTQSRTSS